MTVEWNFASAGSRSPTPSPQRPALVQGERITSWGEWDDRSARLAAAFKDLGLSDDGKVASYLYNSTEYMEGVFATWKCGAGAGQRQLPLPRGRARLPPRPTRTPRSCCSTDRSATRSRRSSAQIPTLKAIVQVDDGSPLVEGALRYEDLIASHDPRRAERPRATTSTSSTPAGPPGCRRASCGATRTCSCRSCRSSTGSRVSRSPRTGRPVRARSRRGSRTRARPRCTSPRRRSCTAPGS